MLPVLGERPRRRRRRQWLRLAVRILRFHCSPCGGASAALKSADFVFGSPQCSLQPPPIHVRPRGSAADELPAIVVKAQEDAGCRSALVHMGYSTVRSEHARQRRERFDRIRWARLSTADYGFRPRLVERGTTPNYCANSAALSVDDVGHDHCGSRLCAGCRDGGPMSCARQVAHRATRAHF